MPETRSILVVDDHDMVGRGIAGEICAQGDVIRRFMDEPDLQITATSVIGLERAEKHLRREGAHLVILDLNLEDGRTEAETLEELCAILARTNSRAAVTLYSGQPLNHPHTRSFLKAALNGQKLKGVMLKSAPAVRVVEGIGRLLLGEEFYPTEVVRALAVTESTTPGGPQMGLTAREWDVAKLLSEGMPNKKIASKLNLSEPHVRQVMSDILDKLQAGNRTEAALKVFKAQNGLPNESKAGATGFRNTRD